MKNRTMEEQDYPIDTGRNARLHVARVLALILALALHAACGKEEPGDGPADSLLQSGELIETQETSDWQSQYDLGMRLLGEGKYEEAVIAFSAAIEIEPKRAAAYMARGDAYASMAKPSSEAGAETGADATELSVSAAEDYGRAVELLNAWYGDGTPDDGAGMETAWMLPEGLTYSDAVSRIVELYRQLAADYAAAEDYEAATEALRRAQELLESCTAASGDGSEMPGITAELLEQLRSGIEGQLQDYERLAGAGQLNAYGTTIFEQRENYEAYEEMPAERRVLIDRLAECALSGDAQGLEGYLPEADSPSEFIYTEKEGYRIMMSRFSSASGDGCDVYIEVREENGAAKACLLSHGGAGVVIEERIYASGRSVNWQWDGEIVVGWKTSTVHEDGSWGLMDTVTKGLMKDGLREGVFTQQGTSEFHGESYEDVSDVAFVTTYEKGVCSTELEDGPHATFHDAMGLTLGMDDDGSEVPWVWDWIFW